MGQSSGDPTGRRNCETQGALTIQCWGPGNNVGHVQGDGSIELILAQHTV